jgi:glycosyltransferase involved in cell wall biosynthesis
MKKTPRVSIIMPVYNGEKYLKDAIKGVLVQTFKDFELIIINDNSTDRSKNIAEEFALGDPRIVVADNTNHPKGLFGALNSALDLCNGELIARTDGE